MIQRVKGQEMSEFMPNRQNNVHERMLDVFRSEKK